jgi:hypothetical protein
MRHLLLCLALALPAAPAAAEYGGAVYRETSDFVPAYQLHRHYHYLGDGMWAPRQFSRDDGFFHRGGGVGLENGRAVYDYDRDYPYDFPRGRDGGEEPGFVGDEMMRDEEECRVVRVPDARSGSAEVRICS